MNVRASHCAASDCPVCGSAALASPLYLAALDILQCSRCRLQFRRAQPSDRELRQLYDDGYCLPGGPAGTVRMKKRTAEFYLAVLRNHLPPTLSPRLFEVGFGRGDLLEAAQEAGFEASGIDLSEENLRHAQHRLGREGNLLMQGDFLSAALPSSAFSACVMADALEHLRDPSAALMRAHEILAPGGILLIATPCTDSISARLMRGHWVEYKEEHLFYFSTLALRELHRISGFELLEEAPGWKRLSLDYVFSHFERFGGRTIRTLVRGLRRVLGKHVSSLEFWAVPSGIFLCARKGPGKDHDGLRLNSKSVSASV